MYGMNMQNASPEGTNFFQEPAESSVLSLVSRIREQGNAFLAAALAERNIHDLLPAHGAVLHALFAENPMRMQDMAKRIGRKKNTVTGLINTLEARGYCRRERDSADGRGQRIFLTSKGESMRKAQEEISAQLLRQVWKGVDGEDRQACMRILAVLLRNLTDRDAGE